MSFLGGIAGGIGSLVGGPVGGMIGKAVGDGVEGAFGGDKNKSSIGQMTSLLTPDGLKGELNGKINPELATRALNLMSEAKTPEEKSKLLDVAICAMGGKPDQVPSSMNALTNPALLANDPPPAPAADADDADDVGDADEQPAPQAEAGPPPEGAEHAGNEMPHRFGGEEMRRGPGEGMHHMHHGMHGGTTIHKSETVSANGVTRHTETTIHRDGHGQHHQARAAGETQAAPSSAANGGLSVNGNSVDTGRYLITASKDKDGDVKIFDKQTNSNVEAFGDPHLVTSDGDKAAFQKNGLSIKLPDGTNVHLKPTATNDKGVSWLAGAMVEKGGQAVTMSGMHDGALQTSQVQPDSQGLRSQYLTPNQTVLSADKGDVGHLSLTDACGKPTTALNSKDHETLLDGMGGSLGKTGRMPQDAFSETSTESPSRCLPINNPMMAKLSQAEHLNLANVTDPGLRNMNTYLLQAQLQAMMQTSEA